MSEKVIHRQVLANSSRLCGTWGGEANLETPTCKKCLKIVERDGLKNRSDFTGVPTFNVVRSDRGFATFTCPVCGKENHHGKGDGHRVSHCDCWSGYYINTPQPPRPSPSPQDPQ